MQGQSSFEWMLSLALLLMLMAALFPPILSSGQAALHSSQLSGATALASHTALTLESQSFGPVFHSPTNNSAPISADAFRNCISSGDSCVPLPFPIHHSPSGARYGAEANHVPS